MNIPPFYETKYVNEDGRLTTEMQIYNDELNQALSNGLSDSGWTFPQITHDALTALQPDGSTQFYETMPDGTGWYEKTNNEIVFKVNGALVKVLTGVYP